MSTQRYISTSFWDDEWIQTLDPSEKLLYLYYMTNPLTNIAGIYKVTERRVSFDTGFTQATIQHIMQKFEKAGKTFRHGEWIIIPTWAKHQKVSERDNNRKGIDSILKALPDEVFIYAVEKGYKYIYINELGRPLQDPSNTLNYSNLNSDIDSDSDSDSDLDIDASTDKPSAAPKTKTGNVFTPIFDTYITMYESIYGIKPVIVYSRITEQLKKITKDITVEQIVSAIGYSRDDDFAKKAKHELGVILSAGVIGRLVNASSQNSSPLPRQDSAPAVEVVCCGQPYSHVLGFCKVCGKSYKRDGTER